MRITCPSCHATYEVPDAMLAGGKAARCARCATEWMPVPAMGPPALPLTAPAAPPPRPLEEKLRAEPRLASYRPRTVDTDDDARPPPRDDEIEPHPRRRLTLAAWIVSILVLALLIWAAFAFRSSVMGAWPPSARLYAALGLQ